MGLMCHIFLIDGSLSIKILLMRCLSYNMIRRWNQISRISGFSHLVHLHLHISILTLLVSLHLVNGWMEVLELGHVLLISHGWAHILLLESSLLLHSCELIDFHATVPTTLILHLRIFACHLIILDQMRGIRNLVLVHLGLRTCHWSHHTLEWALILAHLGLIWVVLQLSVL